MTGNVAVGDRRDIWVCVGDKVWLSGSIVVFGEAGRFEWLRKGWSGLMGLVRKWKVWFGENRYGRGREMDCCV